MSRRGPSSGRKENRSPSIAFSWKGLPQYGARLLRKALSTIEEPCVVIGSPPDVPIRGMAETLGSEIIWIDDRKKVSWDDLGLEPPRIFFQSGWGYPAFNCLGRQVKRNGGHVVCFSDANWRRDFRQTILGPLVYRSLHKPFIDFAIVAGRQGTRLMRYLGMPNDRIFIGYYGADPELFCGGPPLPQRPKTFLYVGQFIQRKDVLNLVGVFVDFAKDNPDWSLRMIGSGPLQAQIASHPRIVIEDFLQPEDLVKVYRQARFLVLPSLVEAWGLVVHEAALTGCGLVLSDAIGSADDLATTDNCFRFRAGNRRDMLSALRRASALRDEELVHVEETSRALARQFGPDRFAVTCLAVIDRIRSDEA